MLLFSTILLSAEGSRLLGAEGSRSDAGENEPTPSFRNEVMAVLSKAGCNLGTCHGNKNGKGGFLLSLRGQDPDIDYRVLTREHGGRRIDVIDLDRSMILLKALAKIPHEGGQRFAKDSKEHRVLRAWIENGAPADDRDAPALVSLDVLPRDVVLYAPDESFQLEVRARFSDESDRDLTNLAVYETSNQVAKVSPSGRVSRAKDGESTVLVRYLDRQVPVRVAFVPERAEVRVDANRSKSYIDEHVFRKLERLRIEPSRATNDIEFLRRVYVDLIGVLPSAKEARAFLADASSDKRATKIDELLERPEFSDFWALKWSDLLRNEERQLDRKGVQNFHQWIRGSIAAKKPMDEFARELLSARGSTYVEPATNFYRAHRKSVLRAEAAAQVFLGRRLQCAKCHNHPFDRWTQDDYYDWAALFSRVRYKIVENRRRDRSDKHEFQGEQIVWTARSGSLTNPRTGGAATPRFLGVSKPTLKTDDDWLGSLASWVASPENPFFARAQVNRIWFHLLGRGIVEPVDDFRATNPPSHPKLLEALADDFSTSGFDLRHLVRRIANSATYQLASEPNASNGDDVSNFAKAPIVRLSAEQLLDSLARVHGVEIEFNGYPSGLRASQIPGIRAVRLRDRAPSSGDEFLRLFGKPPRLLTCECERTVETTLTQAFQRISGPFLQQLLTRSDNRLTTLLASKRSNREVVESLYWSTLSREPNAMELSAHVAYLDEGEDRRAALEDVLWSLVNSKEFVLRR